MSAPRARRSRRHRDFIVGVKARLSRDVAGTNDYEVLRRAQEVASSFGLPVMIHMGQTISPLPQAAGSAETRRHRDAHVRAAAEQHRRRRGRILPEVLAARRRGVWFDVGNGRTDHIRWDIVEKIMQAGFWPDTFSTDWNAKAARPASSIFPNCMSKLLGYGMSVHAGHRRATVNAARVFRSVPRPRHVECRRARRRRGARAPRRELRVRRQLRGTITGRQRFFPSRRCLQASASRIHNDGRGGRAGLSELFQRRAVGADRRLLPNGPGGQSAVGFRHDRHRT